MQPRRIIDALGELREECQVLSAEIQPAVGSAEVKALVGAEFTFGILATVSAQSDQGAAPGTEWERVGGDEPRFARSGILL